MMLYVQLFVVMLFVLVDASWSLRSENITINRGDRLQLRCPLPSSIVAKDSIVQWKKWRSNDDFQVVSINGKVPQSLQSFYQTNLTNQTSSLELLEADRRDSTLFICEIFESQTIVCQFNLIVLIKPEATLLTIDRDDLDEYQTVTMTCSSKNGNPSPQYTWYRNGTLITPLSKQVINEENHSSYSFNVTRYDHLIHYQCEIFNSALNQPIRLEQQLHVKYRPYVNILHGTNVLSIEVNSTIPKIVTIERQPLNLTCLFDANPHPNGIYWISNSMAIIGREKTLFLPEVSSSHSGIYMCIVENVLGRANQSIYLDVQYSPRVRPSESPIIVNRSQPVVLRCNVDANPMPYAIVWSKNNKEILSENQTNSLIIDSVERNHSGVYTCSAFNRFFNNQISNGSTTIEVIVQTRPIIETTFSKIATEIGQSLTIFCRVSGQPMPRVFWKSEHTILPCDRMENGLCSLHFSKIEFSNFGSYRCIAENILGIEEWTLTVVSRGKPETPINIFVSDIDALSFRLLFTPSFDGGSGSQQFFVEVTENKSRTSFEREISFTSDGSIIDGLNDSTLYEVRLRSRNDYGASQWSHKLQVKTIELVVRPEDLPQLHTVSYHSRQNMLSFEYTPIGSRSKLLSDEQICLNIRPSSDGKLFQASQSCLSINHRRVQYRIAEDFPFLRLSICWKKHPDMCGSEIEMKEEWTNRNVAPIVLGIIITTGFLIILISMMIIVLCSRSRKSVSKTNKIKLDTDEPDHDFNSMISRNRFQNPYHVYNQTNPRSSLYDFSLHDFHQHAQGSSFVQPGELSKDDYQTSYGIVERVTIGARSSESSCATQNSNIILPTVEINAKNHSLLTAHYGFPTISVRCTSKQTSFSSDQISSSSDQSTIEDQRRRPSYEVMV